MNILIEENKLIINREYLRHEIGLPGEPYDDRFEIVEDRITSNSRWSIHHELIIKFDGDYYMAEYSVGATELQEEEPWEYDNEVTFTRVKPVEVTVMKYVPVKE